MSTERRIRDGLHAVVDRLSAFLTGGSVVAVLARAMPPDVQEVKIFQREQGKPAVMRTYKSGRDGLLVQDGENEGRYIPLYQYLNTIKDKSDREIENATIRKIAEWYN